MQYGHIKIDPEIISGMLCFGGPRMPVQNLLDYLEGGNDLDEFPDDFPSVTREAAISVLDMAKKTLTNQELLPENFGR